MGLTERQAHAQLIQHALEEEAKASFFLLVDLFNAVEQLHGLDLTKIIPKLKTDARWAHVPRHNKSPSKISVVKLIKGLPMHIMGCLLSRQPCPNGENLATLTPASIQSANCFEHVAKAFRLLSTLSEMCTEMPPLRENGSFGPDHLFTLQLIDAVNLALLTVAGPEADKITTSATENHSFKQGLTRAEMVPAALRALALITSAQAPPERPGSRDHYNWHAVSEATFQHPRGPALIDSAFEACRVLVRGVRDSLCSPFVEGDNVYALAYSAGGALELLTAYCSSPLFYRRMMLHDPQGGSALRLILACLAIHDAPLAAPPFSRVSTTPGAARPILAATQPPYPTDKGRGAAELLAARGFALLLLLGEYEKPTYLDDVFSGQETKALAEQLVGRSAAYVGQVLLRPPTAQFPPAAGEGQMAINVLRAAELLSDDSNFRVALIPGLAPTLAQLLAHLDANRFASMWCLGEEAVVMMGLDSELLVNSCSKKAYAIVDKYAAASKEYHAQGLGTGGHSVPGLPQERVKMGRLLALERSILLSKLLVNLHYYDDSLPVGLKDAFVNALTAAITATTRDPASRAAAMDRAATNMENLFAVAWEFGSPEPMKNIELMAEVDMEQSQNLLEKLQAAAAQAEVPASPPRPLVQPVQSPASSPEARAGLPPPPPPRPAAGGGRPPMPRQQMINSAVFAAAATMNGMKEGTTTSTVPLRPVVSSPVGAVVGISAQHMGITAMPGGGYTIRPMGQAGNNNIPGGVRPQGVQMIRVPVQVPPQHQLQYQQQLQQVALVHHQRLQQAQQQAAFAQQHHQAQQQAQQHAALVQQEQQAQQQAALAQQAQQQQQQAQPQSESESQPLDQVVLKQEDV